jgi:arylsulfatase A
MRPTDKGFQEALVHKGGGIGQAAGPAGNSYFNPILEHNNVSTKYQGYCDDIFTDAALNFMEKESDKPFFIYLATNLPHFPLDISDERADPYRKLGIHELNAKTYGMIANVDVNFGRLMAKLKEMGIEDNTIVIFMSDNGPRTKRTKNDVYPDRYNMNLRGTKTSVYENGIRSPFFIRWPGKIAAGVKLTQMAAHIDLLPTLAEAAQAKIPDGLKINGISLLPLLRSRVDVLPEREIYLQGHHGPEPVRYVHFTVRTPRYKLISPHDNPYGPIAPLSSDEIKRTLASLELYDIEKDPSEIKNIAREHPDIVDDLLSKYVKWFDEVMRERGDDWPQKIYAGTEFQPVVHLSRFDWGGPQAFTAGQRLGYWDIRTEPGVYRIKATFPEVSKASTAYIRYQGMELQKPVGIAESEIVFDQVKLPGTTGKLEVFIRSDRTDTGVQFVDLERLD